MTAEHAKMLAEITKIGETGPKAADAAVQSLRRAREAEVSEAEAPSDLESLEHLLGDLEVGAGETGGEVIEHLGELDASAEDTAKVKAKARSAALLAAFAVASAKAKTAAKIEARAITDRKAQDV